MTDKIIVLCTCGSEDEAERLARALVESKLAACVSVIAPVKSYYMWQEKMEMSAEWLLVIKTTAPNFLLVQDALKSMHSYQLPEVIALPVVAGSEEYLAWIDQGVLPPDGQGE